MSSTQSFHGCWNDTSVIYAGLLASLKPYQRRALAWMVAREESGKPAWQSRSIILVPAFRGSVLGSSLRAVSRLAGLFSASACQPQSSSEGPENHSLVCILAQHVQRL